MPELPEVETTARQVGPRIQGRRILAARASWTRSLGGASLAAFRRSVVGARFARTRRRAKFIVLDLQRAGVPAGSLLVHLRMSGRLVVEAPTPEPRAHERVALDLEGPLTLRFLDVRKFGRMCHVRDPEPGLRRLGPEPLEAGFTAAWLHDALRSRRRLLKPLLLDQGFVAGLGNIYVDEVLHRARLHPARPSQSVSAASARALHAAIQQVLAAAIARQGSSFDASYRTPEGQPGGYQSELRVYGRQGRACPACGATIRRLVVAQRGTHVCPRCQRPPRVPARLNRAPGLPRAGPRRA